MSGNESAVVHHEKYDGKYIKIVRYDGSRGARYGAYVNNRAVGLTHKRKSSALSEAKRHIRSRSGARENPMTKNEKYAAYAAVGGAVVLGGALIYHFSKSSTSSGSGSTSGPVTHNVNALAATINNVLGTPVHANIGDTIAVELGPVTFGHYVDQSTANLVLQPHSAAAPYTMSYKVVGSGDMNSKSVLAIGIKGNVGNVPPAQIVAFPVVVP